MLFRHFVILMTPKETDPSGRSADGSASGLGPEGRRFEPCRPDHKNRDPRITVFVLTDPSQIIIVLTYEIRIARGGKT